MGILRTDRVSGLGGANAINGSVFFGNANMGTAYDSLKTEPSSDFIMGTGDFTLEGWFYLGNVTQNWQALIGDTLYGSAGGWTFYVNAATLYFYKGGAAVVNGGTVTANTWHHLAFSRASGSNKLFIDGAVAATASDSTNYTHNVLSIGANNVDKGTIGANGFDGYASNVRVTKGTALYTAAFTPPTTRLEKRSDTVLLCCQSPGNAEQEATGKIIIGRGNAAASHFAPDLGEDHGTTFTDNTKFDTLSYMVPPGGTTAESNRGRAVMMGGMVHPTAAGNVIEYLQIQSGGMTKDFGDLPTARGTGGPVSSSTRGVMCGGLDGSTRKNEIEYITIATTSNALDFGNLSEPIGYNGGLSNQTRGVTAGGNGPSSPNGNNVMQYITIASIGNATDFGDLVQGGADRIGAASPTRGIFFAGKINPGSWTQTDQIDYITIATTGNAQDFGNTSETRSTGGACSSATRAVYGGGYKNTPSPQTEVNTIDYIEIATTGNAVDFGDLTVVGGYIGSTSNGTRGIFGGRMDVGPAGGNTTIDSVTIASLGDAVDWGEMTGSSVRRSAATVSDSHGGIS